MMNSFIFRNNARKTGFKNFGDEQHHFVHASNDANFATPSVNSVVNTQNQ